MVEHRLLDEGLDVERIESPVDWVPLGERVVHRDEGRVLSVYWIHRQRRRFIIDRNDV